MDKNIHATKKQNKEGCRTSKQAWLKRKAE
jgi:hypothetical protein